MTSRYLFLHQVTYQELIRFLYRLDRLLLLLDTGSSTSVRNTAAKQLAQLAVKSIISDVGVSVGEDVKNNRQHVSFRDPGAWGELMAVVARVCSSESSPEASVERLF